MRQRGIVIMGGIALLCGGLWSAVRLPIDAVPDITNTQVQINSEVKGLAPEEIEKLVSYPLEMVMFGIPRLTELRSLSKTGLSQLTLVFEDGTDIYRARQLISERLQNANESLPPGITPRLLLSPPVWGRFIITSSITPKDTRERTSRYPDPSS